MRWFKRVLQPSSSNGGGSKKINEPDLRARHFLLIAIFLSQLANFTSISPTVAAVGIAATVIAWYIKEAPRKFIWRAALLLSTVVVGVVVFITYGKLIGRDSGIALLFMFGPLKLIEAKTTRDYMVVWGLGLMLFVASFFENLGLLAAITVAPIIVVYIASLRLFDARADELDAPSGWSHIKAAGIHTLMGIPLAAMLFILFPRATAPLWGMRDPTTGQTGLSEEMKPGDISKLIRNRDTAFRVEFEGRKPTQQALYWRGPVLRQFDGLTWSVGDLLQRGEFISFTPEEMVKESLIYTVTAERLDTRWLPVLEVPIAFPTGPAVEKTVFLTDAQQIGVRRASNGATAYRVQSFARSSYPGEAPASTGAELKTGPRIWNQKSRDFAAQLAVNYPDPRQRIAAILKYFNQEQFFYTLDPPLYSVGEKRTTAIDAFLFEGRRGFCEHYANATTFLLRASGIPARVVTGYQGGEWTSSGYMIVRQSDAHAWVEAWVAGRWIRIDPTAAVAPDRIELGVEQALPETERDVINGRRWWSSDKLAAFWDEANFGYTKWVIGFDRDRQKELLRDLGLGDMNPFAAAGWMLIAISVSGVVVALGWWLLRKRGERDAEPSVRVWRTLRKRLIKAGLNVAPHETVASAMRRATTRWPQYRAQFESFAKRYNAIRFTSQANDVTGENASARELSAIVRELPFARTLKRASASVPASAAVSASASNT
jgi:protein-glutamine gamma-glutamyltransferase